MRVTAVMTVCAAIALAGRAGAEAQALACKGASVIVIGGVTGADGTTAFVPVAMSHDVDDVALSEIKNGRLRLSTGKTARPLAFAGMTHSPTHTDYRLTFVEINDVNARWVLYGESGALIQTAGHHGGSEPNGGSLLPWPMTTMTAYTCRGEGMRRWIPLRMGSGAAPPPWLGETRRNPQGN